MLNNGLDYDLITSVPMNRKKKWERGFNQSELIAMYLSRKMHREYIPLLSEKYGARTQRNLRYKERFLNVINRYRVKNPDLVKGKILLLIDDVFTTGATINECARILKAK